MTTARQDDLQIDDPALDGGEWLFRRDGQVFGPLSSREIARLLYRGELDARTPVSAGDGRWAPVGDVPPFLVHARKAEAGLRVEREVTGARELARRRSRRAAAGVAFGAVLLVVGAVGGTALYMRRQARVSPELQGFPAGITLSSVARIDVGRRARGDDEVEVPIEPEPGRPARRAPAPAPGPQAARPAAGGAVGGGDLVLAQFDERKIQAVVGREQRTLAPCFKAEADRTPDFQGEIPIEFAIGNDGRVASLWIDEPRFKQGALRQCLERALAGWRFDPFPGQRPTVSLAFRIGR